MIPLQVDKIDYLQGKTTTDYDADQKLAKASTVIGIQHALSDMPNNEEMTADSCSYVFITGSFVFLTTAKLPFFSISSCSQQDNIHMPDAHSCFSQE